MSHERKGDTTMATATERLTGAAYKTALADLRSVAFKIDRACESHCARDYSDLCDLIREQEKQHRRLAPVGYRHRFSLDGAVYYFIVKTFAEAFAAPLGETVAEIAMLRRDYQQARFIVHRLRARSPNRLTPGLISEVMRCADAYDYTALVGDS